MRVASEEDARQNMWSRAPLHVNRVDPKAGFILSI